MSEQPEALQLYESFLRTQVTTLEAERARVEAERARIDAELSRARTALAEMTRLAEVATASPPPQTQEEDKTECPEIGLFANLQLTDAIAKYLQMVGKETKSIKEIWAALEKEGFKVLSGHPTRAVSESLRKRANRRGDVFQAGNRWGAVKNFSEAHVRRLTRKYAGMGGRPAEEHAAKTSAGMERHRAAGGRIGAPLFMTPDRIEAAKKRLIAGESVAKIAADWGISRQTLYSRFSRAEIKRLRQEAATEKERGDSEGNRSFLSVVK